MSDYFKCYPFVAVAGQEQAKRAILIALVNHKAGGLLISGVTGTAKSVLVRGAAELSGDRKLLNLPLNVTEDMLFGSIDLEYAVTQGERRFEPGLLGRADGNIIYIDEVNLLRPELLTAVLDINMAGENRVERDGISFVHKTEYTVIGTMDPHEGVLPNHLLDRFGLFVETENLKEKEQRKEIMQRLLDFAKDATAFRAKYKKETEQLRAQIAKARELLSEVEIGDAMMELAVQYCSQAFCAGHRADLYLLETAKAIAALAGRTYILPKDMEEAALYVLPHRMRKPPEPQPEEQPPQEEPEDMEELSDQEDDDMDSDDSQENLMPPPPPDNDTDNHDEDKPNQEEDNQEPPEQDPQNNSNQEDKVDGIDMHFPFPKMVLDMGKDQIKRKGSGKRSLTKTDLKQGRYVRAELPKEKVNDLAFDATIRAAAPYQRHRPKNDCAINIQQADLRQRVREKRIGTTFLFLVDASGSMGAQERMKAVKGAIFAMLQEAYQKRDKVGMIAFRRKAAEELLPITRSVDLAQKRLAELPTGGKTPLAEGLAQAFITLDMQIRKEPDTEPVLVLVTDGRANSVVQEGEDPVESAMKLAKQIHKAKITSIVIDTETDFIKLGVARQVAAEMGANYYKLKQLSQGDILHIIRNLGI
ncbi:VWA domain-containing protein [Succiniclasticum ruminis]|uniref:Magnesium chelatase subunit D n=1 Tax=Succiniclasticum ruminis DSM 9236 TaxID=1123323 RepID=A0A1I1XQK9_9FIRM|nr:VWA domain-containing protein [Succiniclasticum ruminis]SFE09609.1 magnesium chelatase subunit D [Succiniclasticum ruminis DSM 9236]